MNIHTGRLACLLILLTCSGAWATPHSDWLSCNVNLKNIGLTITEYADSHGGKHPSSVSVVRKKVSRWLKCPAAGRDSYSKSYKTSDGAKSFKMHCSGKHHGVLGYPPNTPTYDNLRGLSGRRKTKKHSKYAAGQYVEFNLRSEGVGYRFRMPEGWVYRSGNVGGLSLENPRLPGVKLELIHSIPPLKPVKAWMKERLGSVKARGAKIKASGLKTVAGLAGFQATFTDSGKVTREFWGDGANYSLVVTVTTTTKHVKEGKLALDSVLRSLKKKR